MTTAMASGTDSQGNSGQAAIDRFAAMMIERMQQMKDTGWKQGWIGGASGYAGLPQNVGGRNYSGSNSFFLQMHTAAMNYQLPVYLTFKQAHNLMRRQSIPVSIRYLSSAAYAQSSLQRSGLWPPVRCFPESQFQMP